MSWWRNRKTHESAKSKVFFYKADFTYKLVEKRLLYLAVYSQNAIYNGNRIARYPGVIKVTGKTTTSQSLSIAPPPHTHTYTVHTQFNPKFNILILPKIVTDHSFGQQRKAPIFVSVLYFPHCLQSAFTCTQ